MFLKTRCEVLPLFILTLLCYSIVHIRRKERPGSGLIIAMAGKKIKQQRWPKDEIRREILRLDGITGLKGGNVTIRLYEQREPLGCFTFIDPVRMTFGFSSVRFEDPKFTRAEALDGIRHEYAHYMEYMLFGESTDHGPNWKECCRRIGARPQNYYTQEWQELARARDKKLQERTRVDGFSVGSRFIHPTFGEGVVEEVRRTGMMTMIKARFGDSVKTLDVDWARKNCKYKL